MHEKCPLLYGQIAIGEIPEVCISQCEKRWDEAIKNSVYDGDYDFYEGDHSETCNSYLEHSHMGLQAPSVADQSPNRVVSLVDMCGHGVEIGEQGYSFDCPHTD